MGVASYGLRRRKRFRRGVGVCRLVLCHSLIFAHGCHWLRQCSSRIASIVTLYSPSSSQLAAANDTVWKLIAALATSLRPGKTLAKPVPPGGGNSFCLPDRGVGGYT